MKILLATDSTKTNDYLAIHLVEEGAEPYKAVEEEKILKLIDKISVDAVLIDIDSQHYNDMETIKTIKEKIPETSVIIMTTRSGLDFVKDIIAIGAYGIISKLDELNTQYTNIIALLDSLNVRKKEQRKHIRVKPTSSQHNNFKLRIPGLETFYQGEVKDISIGGIAIIIASDPPPPDAIMFKGKMVHLNIELGPMNITVKGVVMLRGREDAAILFKELSAGFKRRLAEYIISRIEEDFAETGEAQQHI